jgi:hypothetical protein
VPKRIHNDFLNGITIGRGGTPLANFRMGRAKFNNGEYQVDAPGVTDDTKIFVNYFAIIGKSGMAFEISRVANQYVIVRSLKSSMGAIETTDQSIFDWVIFQPAETEF